MAQYVGFSDFFGRALTELPNYAYRFGTFLLNILRRVVANPVGFATMVVGITLGTYIIDRWLDSVISSFTSSLNSFADLIYNMANSITPPPCSLSNILNCVEGALLMVVKYIMLYVIYPVVNAITYFINVMLSGVKYIIEYQLYIICNALCTYIQPLFANITAGYVAVKSIQSIWRHSGGIVRVFTAPIGGFVASLMAYATANTLLDVAFSLTGISCSPTTKSCREPPPLNILVTQITPPTVPSNKASITESITYSLTLSSESLAMIKVRAGESTSYGLVIRRPPSLTYSITESIAYSLNLPPPQIYNVKSVITEGSKYSLVSSIPSAIAPMVTEMARYVLTASVSPLVSPPSLVVKCSTYPTGIICTESVTSSASIPKPLVVTESVTTSAG